MQGPAAAKAALRDRLSSARRALPPSVRAERAQAITRSALTVAAEAGGPICAYFPVGVEPGSSDLVDALVGAGHEVLLPVVPAERGPLEWAVYRGPHDLAAGPLGLREPAGPRRGPAAIGTARLVLVPGLAADPHGRRLGRGAGYYDRTLGFATPGTPLVVVLYDEEVLPEVPAEQHDHAVTGILTPGTGRRWLGNND